MNTKIIKTMSIIGGLLALAMSLSAETPIVTVNIPFTFVAGGKTLPAGNYMVEETNKAGLLIIRGTTHDSAVVVFTVKEDNHAVGKANVTFDRSGSDVLLSTVQVPEGSTYTLLSTEQKLAATAAVPKVALKK